LDFNDIIRIIDLIDSEFILQIWLIQIWLIYRFDYYSQDELRRYAYYCWK
jgi:hypothetical protein